MTQADDEKGIRSFVAVALPTPVRQAIMDIGQQLSAGRKGLSPVRKLENLHLTLAFLGNVPSGLLDRFGAELAEAVRLVPAFALRVQGTGAFPSASRARVLWAGVQDESGGLAAVAGKTREVIGHCALPLEERPFRGHVTFARARGTPVDVRAALEPFSELLFGETQVTELHVYESRLGREGSTYTLRTRAPLAPAQPT